MRSVAGAVDGLGDAQQAQDLALQVGEFDVEHLDGVADLGKTVTLRKAEQAKHLLGDGAPALAVLGVQGQFVDCLALHRQA